MVFARCWSITFNEDNTYKRQNGCSSTYIITNTAITLSKAVGSGMICPQALWRIVKLTSTEMVVFTGSTNYTFKKIN